MKKRPKLASCVLLILLLGLDYMAPTKTHAQLPAATIMSLAWSPDGTMIAVGGADGLLQIRDPSAQPLLDFTGLTEDIYSVVWSPDGTKIATGGSDKMVKIWNVRDSRYEPEASIATFAGHEDMIRSVAWSPDGSYLVSVSRSEFYTLRIWDVVNYDPKVLGQYSVSNLLGAAWNPDDQTLVLASEVGLFIFPDPFHFDTANLANYLFGEFIVTPAVAWSGNGMQLVAGTVKGQVDILDASSGAIWDSFALHTDLVYSAAWNPTNNLIATLALGDPITIWDANTGSVIRQISTVGYGAAAWSPDGQWLAYSDVEGNLKIMPAPIPSLVEVNN